MDPSITQFVSLKDLITFPGQMLVAGTFAEIFKRLIPALEDGTNRLLITAMAVVVNFIATLSQAAWPIGGLAWSTVALLSVINGFVIALASIKSVEFISERKEREITRDLAAGGVQVTTEVTAGQRPVAGAHAPEPSPLAHLATEQTEDPKRREGPNAP